MTIHATDKQRLAWLAWQNDAVDDVIFGGAAGGGKSMWLGQVLTGSALRFAGTKYFIGRKELKTLMQTTYITLTQKVFPQYGLTLDDWHLNGKYNVIHFRNGSSIDLLDVNYAPRDPLFDRFGSSEYTQGGGDELSEWPFKAYDVLKSRVGRWKNMEYRVKSKFGGTLNPSQDWPYRMFYLPWKKAGSPQDPRAPLVSMKAIVDGKEEVRTFVFIQSYYKDNPFLTKDYIINLATINDPVLKARLMAGDWEFVSAHDSLFEAPVVADLFSTVLPESRDYYLTVDVARFGGDRIVRTLWRGWDAIRISWKVNQPLTTTTDDVRSDMDMYGIPRDHVLYDEDGIGGGLGDMLPGIIGFHGGAAPFGRIGELEVKENYENLRTQCAYHLSMRARKRLVAVSEPNIETRELIAEELPHLKRRDADRDGKLKIKRKEDIIQALGRSPDFADTLLMRSYFDLREREPGIAAQQGGEVHVFIPDMEV